MSIQPFGGPAEGWRVSGPGRGAKGPGLPPPPWLTLLVFALLLAGLAAWPGPRLGAAFTATATPAPAPAPATPRPCGAAEAQLSRNAALAAEQRWSRIVAESEAALSRGGLCPNDRLALQGELLTARIELLLGETPAPYDQRRQQAQRERYEELSAEAKRLGVLRADELSVARRAYVAGAFLVSVAAYEEAWRSGALQAHDQEHVRQYASSLYNLGYWWTRADGPAYQAGLAMLATSYAVDQAFAVGSGAAEELLGALAGPDRSAWPRPAPSPLLVPGS